MSARTALITGALGQDGTLLGQLLIAEGYRVVGVIREPDGRDSRAVSATELVHADLTDARVVRQLLDRWQPDEIYHLAAYHHSSQETAKAAEALTKRRMVETHFTITQTLAFSVLESGAKSSLVFAGSSQMYSAEGRDLKVDERTPRRPSTFYGQVKAWAAELLARLRADHGLRAGTAILFNHESPLRRDEFVSRKITRAAAAIRAGRRVELEIGNSRARVDWSSAADVARALHLMAAAAVARDYVIASGTLHSVEDLLRIAFSRCGLDWRDHTKVLAAVDAPALSGDPSAIESDLGWRRAVSFEQMIQAMVDRDQELISTGAAPG